MTRMPFPPLVLHRWRRQERRIVWCAVLLFVLALIPSLRDSAREQRDANRIAALAATKQAVEQYYNAVNAFPVPDPAYPLACAFSAADRNVSVVSAALRGSAPATTLPKERSPWRFLTMYCPTDIYGTAEHPVARGFTLETSLERTRPPVARKDLEEGRNYLYRIFPNGTDQRYRICGGTDPSCATVRTPLHHYQTVHTTP